MNKFWGVLNASPEKRYKNFISTVADMQMVWLSKEAKLSVWPEENYALQKTDAAKIVCMEVHDFCDLLKEMSNDPWSTICVFPTDKDCIEKHPSELLSDTLDELERIE